MKSVGPKKILRFPAMCTIRNNSMITPVLAMTAFLPTVERHSVRRGDGRAARVASATSVNGRTGPGIRSKT
ncbi:hypothetical protein GCM10022220_67500 [Actinocatenispora rupis]|uniref:Uncharacterized protein n=1 Tax=Actinocatenispora rupis TaxID=519421 RepID=A0A8J3J9Q0_9ACTN|nr:hypothetical protein Aru02nite_29020 [Actinocatenispora rupis]